MDLDQLTEIARHATRESLNGYQIPEQLRVNLLLGTRFENDHVLFELYEPGDTPSDAIVYSTTRVHRVTGEHSTRVFHLAKK